MCCFEPTDCLDDAAARPSARLSPNDGRIRLGALFRADRVSLLRCCDPLAHAWKVQNVTNRANPSRRPETLAAISTPQRPINPEPRRLPPICLLRLVRPTTNDDQRMPRRHLPPMNAYSLRNASNVHVLMIRHALPAGNCATSWDLHCKPRGRTRTHQEKLEHVEHK